MRNALVAIALTALCGACGGESKDKDVSAQPREPSPPMPRGAMDAAAEQALYERLLDSLPSPCGRAQSLRKSMQASAACVRGAFAARYVERLVLSAHDKDQATVLYEDKYVYSQVHRLSLTHAPYLGDPSSPVVLVEFLDYACPFCRRISPWLKKIVASYPGKLVLYYKMAPLVDRHPRSHHAARAALAAHAQGKHAAMHDALFAEPPPHSPDQLRGLARGIGLDMPRYQREFASAKAAVDADLREAGTAQLARTPTLFINGRRYTDQLNEAYLRLWIDEELAVSVR